MKRDPHPIKVPYTHVVQNCEECPFCFYMKETAYEGEWHCREQDSKVVYPDTRDKECPYDKKRRKKK